MLKVLSSSAIREIVGQLVDGCIRETAASASGVNVKAVAKVGAAGVAEASSTGVAGAERQKPQVLVQSAPVVLL